MKTLMVEGKMYKVTDDLKYQHSAGCYAKEVKTETGLKIAVSRDRKNWTFWKTKILPASHYVGQGE